MSDPLPFEKVSLEDAKKALDSATTIPRQKVQEQDWRWARTFAPPVPLKDTTVAWLARLPAEVRPRELCSAYPRIANRLCELWPQQDECGQYFDALTVDRRGRRKGFPHVVAQEIAALRTYYVKPGDGHSLWDNKVYRR